MALGGSNIAGVARYAYEIVGLADFQSDNQRAESAYRDATRGMSDDALRLEVAQDKLRRTLAKGPAAYQAQARAELQLRSAERALRGETDALTRSQARNQTGLSNLKRSLVGLAAGYIGAQGIITLARNSANAAREEELVMGQTRVAIEAQGVSYDRLAPRLERQIALVRQLGFDDEDLAKSFQTLVRSAGSTEQALDQLNLVADISRGRYIDLEAATQIVNKANLGMSGGLRRIGIDVDKNAKSTELLVALNKAYGRSAEEAMNSGTASADRFAVAVEEIEEAIGRGLAPSLAAASEEITEWISKEENLERVQRNVNDAVQVGEDVVRGIASAFEVVRTVAEPVVDILGGVERTVKLIALAYVGLKVKAALGFGATTASSAATSAAGVRHATIFGRAWDAATRPRVMSVTTVGGGAPVGGPGGGPFAPGGRGAPSNAPPPPAGGGRWSWVKGIGWTLVGLGLAGTAGQQGESGGGAPGTLTTVGDFQGLLSMARQGRLPESTIAQLENAGHITPQQARRLRRASSSRAGRGRPGHNPRGDLRDREPTGGGGGGGGGNRFTFGTFTSELARLDEARLDATASPGEADDLRVEKARLALARRALRELKLTRDQRLQVKNERNAALQAIAAIEQAEEQEAAAIEAKRDAARKAAKAKEDARMAKINAAADRVAEARGELLAGTGGTRKNMRQQALKGVDPVVEALKKGGKSKAQSEADAARALQRQVRSSQFEFLGQVESLKSLFGGNVYASGALQVAGGPNPDMFAIANELRQQTGLLSGLATGVKNPGAKYAGTELAYSLDGPTF